MIHATQLNSHASSLRGVDISMSSSEGTLQELDKLYPSDPNQLAEEAIKFIPQSIPYWIYKTSNSEPGTSTKAPHHGALWPETSGEVPKRPNQNVKHFSSKEKENRFFLIPLKKNTSLLQNKYCALFLSLSFCGSYFGFHTVYRMVKRVIHARLRLIPKVRIFWKSAGCGIICWNFGSLEYRNLLEYGLKWFEVYVENGDHCGRLDHRNHRIVQRSQFTSSLPGTFCTELPTVFGGGEFHDSLLHRAWKLMNLYTITLMFGKVTKLQV